MKTRQTQQDAAGLRLKRVVYVLAKTAYEVWRGGKCIGYVWSREGLSYRGSQGWNRGIRLRDFHPIEWHFGETLGSKHERSCGRHTRSAAVEALASASECATWAICGPTRTIVRDDGKLLYDGPSDKIPPDIQKLIDELPFAIDHMEPKP